MAHIIDSQADFAGQKRICSISLFFYIISFLSVIMNLRDFAICEM